VLAIAAGASRIVQSIYAESRRRTYLWWVYGIPWLGTTAERAPGAARGIIGRAYVAMASVLSGGAGPIDRLVAAAQEDPVERDRIAGLAKRAGRRTLPAQIALGANPRTILLGISMIAGSPAWFFLFEVSVLNLVLVASILQQRGSSRRLAALIAREHC